MQEKKDVLLKAENGIPIGQLEAKLEMVSTERQCCSFIDDWYKDIVGVQQSFTCKTELA